MTVSSECQYISSKFFEWVGSSTSINQFKFDFWVSVDANNKQKNKSTRTGRKPDTKTFKIVYLFCLNPLEKKK